MKTVVDFVVAKDPYYEYERAVSAPISLFECRLICETQLLQTRPSTLDNGGGTRVPFFQKIGQVFKTPDTDGWKAWQKNLGLELVVPAA